MFPKPQLQVELELREGRQTSDQVVSVRTHQTAFSFKQKTALSESLTSLKSPLTSHNSRLKLAINIAPGIPQPGSNYCKLSSQELVLRASQAYTNSSFSIFSICFTFNLLIPLEFFSKSPEFKSNKAQL